MARSRKSEFVGPPRPEEKLEWLEEIVGKTIEAIDFGAEKPHSKVHGREGIILYFTDGTSVKFEIGSNVVNLAHTGIRPKDLDTDLMVFTRSAADTKKRERSEWARPKQSRRGARQV